MKLVIYKNYKIILILVLSSLLRFSNLPAKITFTADEAYLSYVAQTLIKNFHIIWIGWSALGFDVYLGPLWIYVIYPFLYLSHGNPIILGYISGFLGVLTTFAIYKIGSKFFNHQVAILSSLSYALLPLLIYYDQKPYPPAIPLISLLVTFALLKVRKSAKWWVVISFLYGLVFNIHLSLVLLAFPILYALFTGKKYLNKKILVSSFLVFIVTVSPLIVFDYYKKGYNIQAPLRAFNASQNSTEKTSGHYDELFSSFGRIWYLNSFSEVADEIIPTCKENALSTYSRPPLGISIVSLAIFISFALNKKTWKDYSRKMLLFVSLTFIIPFTLVTVINPVEYYLLGFFPILLIITSVVIYDQRKIVKMFLLLLMFSCLIYAPFVTLRANTNYGLEAKKELAQQVAQLVDGKPYYLQARGGCQSVGGWRYLFSIYGQRPAKSYDDVSFGWLYPDEITSEKSVYEVLVVEKRASDHTNLYTNYVNKVTSGGYEALIYKISD
ncbi:glycosyltransferase family 39 protein [Candidatus Woesebacteria bacterium]|nr:MAG: glycosyltransferase family 39 protein [Candidatus Woesebacteria bacterium]